MFVHKGVTLHWVIKANGVEQAKHYDSQKPAVRELKKLMKLNPEISYGIIIRTY
jgi:hypothetical protein